MTSASKQMTSQKTSDDENKIVALNNIDETDQEIDLVDLGLHLLDKLHYIVLFLLLGAVLCNLYAYLCKKPTYSSTAKLYIVSASEDSVVNLSDLNIGSNLTKDYQELLLSYPVLDQVIAKLNLDMDSKGLAQLVSLTNPDNTRVLNITVTTTDPQQACDIANTLTEVAVEYLPDTMSTNAPNIAQVARVNNQKVGPSYMKFTIIGALLGMILCMGVFIVGYLMDDTVHSAEDVEKYFGIVPLTSIPNSDKFDVDDAGNSKTAKKERKA